VVKANISAKQGGKVGGVTEKKEKILSRKHMTSEETSKQEKESSDIEREWKKFKQGVPGINTQIAEINESTKTDALPLDGGAVEKVNLPHREREETQTVTKGNYACQRTGDEAKNLGESSQSDSAW